MSDLSLSCHTSISAVPQRVPRPRGHPPKDFPCWDVLRGVWTDGQGNDRPLLSANSHRAEQRRVNKRKQRDDTFSWPDSGDWVDNIVVAEERLRKYSDGAVKQMLGEHAAMRNANGKSCSARALPAQPISHAQKVFRNVRRRVPSVYSDDDIGEAIRATQQAFGGEEHGGRAHAYLTDWDYAQMVCDKLDTFISDTPLAYAILPRT